MTGSRVLLWRLRRFRSEVGGVTPFIMLLFPSMIGLAGLAYDGGNLFAARRETQNIAAAAARDGANDIDVASIYTSNPVLAATAPGTAVTFAGNEGLSASARLLSPTEIEVQVTQTVDMVLLGVVGVGSQSITATATSDIVLAGP